MKVFNVNDLVHSQEKYACNDLAFFWGPELRRDKLQLHGGK